MARIEVDSQLCNGYGNCVMIAPEVFELDEDRLIAIVDDAKSRVVPDAQLREAVADCPAQAIRFNG